MTQRSVFSHPLPAGIAIVIALLLDQVIKYLVEISLPLQQVVPVMPFFALYRTHNLGVAFSMLSGMDSWFIVGMRLIIVGFVLWMWRRTDKTHHFAHFGYVLIVAGALGNLVDRFIYGQVVDYVLFHTATWSFAVFNLADAFITIGAGCVLLQEIFISRARKAD
ncbi:signal peptidase II [Rhizobium halophytocola]|uniref:Lipoprotein signal peptidase n=1 Tax=Rhizobium halophytocola TaxID=735519 RepID=A0ABS4E024_9HYPH|nr:signal peptidase II [Rhizobium halophytocola]MBP1851285.1 signal peptidase II [Rhizobium halophytocola]